MDSSQSEYDPKHDESDADEDSREDAKVEKRRASQRESIRRRRQRIEEPLASQREAIGDLTAQIEGLTARIVALTEEVAALRDENFNLRSLAMREGWEPLLEGEAQVPEVELAVVGEAGEEAQVARFFEWVETRPGEFQELLDWVRAQDDAPPGTMFNPIDLDLSPEAITGQPPYSNPEGTRAVDAAPASEDTDDAQYRIP